MATPVTWFEIISRNSVALGDFYSKLFGWKLEPFPGEYPYSVVETGGDSAIRGGIGEADGPNRIIVYIEVDDPQTYLDRIEKRGGKVIVPVTTIPEVVTYAHFADPEGNVVGLVKAGSPA
jgi:predicted enzyme related to lactoylglutathione lyase